MDGAVPFAGAKSVGAFPMMSKLAESNHFGAPMSGSVELGLIFHASMVTSLSEMLRKLTRPPGKMPIGPELFLGSIGPKRALGSTGLISTTSNAAGGGGGNLA